MMPIAQQIAEGRLVCPRTRLALRLEGNDLVTADGRRRYPIRDGVPFLIADAKRALTYRDEAGEAMFREYETPRSKRRWLARLDHLLARQGDFRSTQAAAAFEAAIAAQPPNSLCLSVGGGPTRAHSHLVNLNLGAFANVDVVGDAYELPYADDVVDAVHCEAVLEHLEFPRRAVAEMFRVLRPGGQLFAATPFLQAFHAYPTHYQNFTVVGHDRLFLHQGFEILSSGACVGPTFALTDLAALYFRTFLPTRILSRGAHRLTLLASMLFRPLDRLVHRSSSAHVLASSVYSHARKLQ